MTNLETPISREAIRRLSVGDQLLLSGTIYCGRDAVLPKIVSELRAGAFRLRGIDLEGTVIFHTAVSIAGIGPTSSNKLEIEESMSPLSERGGVRIHLGKGAIKRQTVEALRAHEAVYAIVPPVTALLKKHTLHSECVAFPELGMEAFYRLQVSGFPAIVAAARGESLF